jgi:hypothetical protein
MATRRRPPRRSSTRIHHPVDESYGGIEWTNEFEGVEPSSENVVNDNFNNNDDEETNYESAEESASTDTTSINNNNIDINYNDDNNGDTNNNDNNNDDNDINNIDMEINIDNNNNNNNNRVTVATCRDNIVSATTLASYLSDIRRLFKWSLVHHPEWFTPYGKRSAIDLLTRQDGETATDHRERKNNTINLLVRNSTTNPLLYMERITASDYMNYLVGVKKKSDDTLFFIEKLVRQQTFGFIPPVSSS